MKIVLSEPDLLNFFTENMRDIYKNRDFKVLKYSESVSSKLIDSKTLSILEKLDIDKFETVFINSKPFTKYCKSIYKMKISTANKNELQHKLLLRLILKGKGIFVCGLEYTDEFFSFKEPEQFLFVLEDTNFDKYPELKKVEKKLKKVSEKHFYSNARQIGAINKHLSKYNINIIKNYVGAAINDYKFISKFNEEMFYQGLNHRGNIISKEAVISIYENERYTKTVDLSRQNERNAFIALYGITYFDLKLEDFYSINGIFSMQQNREADNQKKEASQQVFNIITSENKDELISVIERMGEALCKIPFPPVDLSEHKLIKNNYPLYIGLSDIGKAFSGIIIPGMKDGLIKSIKHAKHLAEFAKIVSLYDAVYKSKNNKKISDYGDYPDTFDFVAKLSKR